MIYLAAALTLTIANAGKVLAIAGLVFGVLQGIKKTFPAIGGWWSVVINVGLAVIGALVLIPPDQLWSLATVNTLLVALIAALGAAGIHGSIKNLGGGSVAPAPIAPVGAPKV